MMPGMKRDKMLRERSKIKRKTKTAKARQPIFVGEYLVADPRVCHGKMTFRGTRVPVETILSYLAKGHSLAYLRKSWPEVRAEAIAEAVRLATELLVQHYQAPKR
jgi:uncharacterized protein (DUF433 family)